MSQAANIYAQALLQTGHAWEDRVNSHLVALGNPKLQEFIKDPFTPKDKLLDILNTIQPLQKETRALFDILLKNKKLLLLPKIMQAYQHMIQTKNAIHSITVTTTKKVDAHIQKGIEAFAKKQFPKQQKLAFSYQTNSKLIAGFTLKQNDIFVDCSILGQLQQLHETLLEHDT